MTKIHQNKLIKTSEIAENAGRSLQNISHAMRELEEKKMIESLTAEKLKEAHLIE
jgi:DNA-binding transcriptional regulator GbsR (MarR family)